MQIAKVHFRYKIWFIISEKDITKCMFFRGGHEAPKILTRHIKKKLHISNSFSLKITFKWIRGFADMNAYNFTEDRNFTFERKL